MAPFIQHLRDDFGLGFFLQVYELSSPPGVCTPPAAGGTPLLNCSLDAPATRALAAAKYSELAAAVPALAGIFVTVEDSWAPRAGYEFSVLWRTQAELPRVVTLFHEAVVGAARLQLIFRLWVFGEPVDWPTLRDNSPPDVRFSIKQTQGDFLLDYPINALLECAPGDACAPRDRRVIVELDAFRQYNGWTSSVAWMGSQWAPRLAAARAAANGSAIDVWTWGAWSAGCTWPDSGPTLVNATPGTYKSWRSWWAPFRLFNGTETNGGFSLGGQANAYLASRLAWADPAPTDAVQIALDFGTLFYGAANAAPVARLLNASFYAWLATSSPRSVGDFTLFWTMMQHDVGTFGKLAPTTSLDDFDAAARASADAVADMEAALGAIDAAAVPAAHPRAYAGAVRAVGVARGYLAAAFAWRAAGLATAQLGRAPAPAACARARAYVAALNASARAFDAAFPRESAAWEVGALDAALYSHPPFLTSTYRTQLEFVEPWAAQARAVCG